MTVYAEVHGGVLFDYTEDVVLGEFEDGTMFEICAGGITPPTGAVTNIDWYQRGVGDQPGTHTVIWRGLDDLGRPRASGTYFCRVSAAGRDRTVKMTLVR